MVTGTQHLTLARVIRRQLVAISKRGTKSRQQTFCFGSEARSLKKIEDQGRTENSYGEVGKHA
jgi:hypothetical protein